MDIFGHNNTVASIHFIQDVGAVYNGSMWVILIDCPHIYELIALLVSIWNSYYNSSYIVMPFNFTAGYPLNVSFIANFTNTFNLSFVIQQDSNYSFTDENSTDNDGYSGQFCFASAPYIMVYIRVFSSCCAVVMLISHILIATLRYIDKELVSPIFITLQSFSVVSMVDGLLCWWDVFSTCEIYFRLDTTISCAVWLGFEKYFESCIYYHLLVLSFLRIYVTLYPLHYQVNLTKKRIRYVLGCMYLFNLVWTPFYINLMYNFNATCGVMELINYEIPVVSTSAEGLILVLSFLVIAVFITGMVISFVKTRLSTARFPTISQRQQSRTASIIIIIFLALYWPSTVLQTATFRTCSHSIFILYLNQWVYSVQLLFHTINPFILCLRLKSVRQKLKAVCTFW